MNGRRIGIFAIADPICEAIGAKEIRIRRIDPVASVEFQHAAGRTIQNFDTQIIAIRIDVIGKEINRNRRVLCHRNAQIIAGDRRAVRDLAHIDPHRCRGQRAGVIRHRIGD